MAIEDLDIYRVAKLMIDRHGADRAAVEAARRSDEFSLAGDVDGATIWRRVVNAIEQITKAEPGDCEFVH